MFEGVIKNKQLNTDSVFCYSPALCVCSQVVVGLSSEFMFEPGLELQTINRQCFTITEKALVG